MDTNLIINYTNGNKKGSKAISNINPEKSNAILDTFAQKVNALTTNTYVDAIRVNKQSVKEPDAQSGSDKQEGSISYSPETHTIIYDGDAEELLFFHPQESTANQEPGIYEMTLLNPTNHTAMERSLSVGDILVAPETSDFTAAFFEYEE